MKLIIENISKKIKKNIVIDQVSMELESGFVYGLSGKNGSGKTMLMRLISGLVYPSSGKIYYDKFELGKDMEFPLGLGLLLENPTFLPHYTGIENLKYIARISGVVDIESLKRTLREVGLDENDKRKYRKYSLGMKQKLGIAAAIFESPQLLILDEPTNSLDAESVECVKKIIRNAKNRGALVILSCHEEKHLLEMVDFIYEIKSGSICGVRGVKHDYEEH